MKPRGSYICDKPECEKISMNRNGIRIHCNREHHWKSTEAEREHWHLVWVQTFFSAAGLQRYFTVDYSETAEDEAVAEEASTTDNQHEISAVLEQWDRAAEKHKQTLDIVDAKVAKTDRTLWFKRTGWPEHLAGCNMRHLSRATRMPDRDESVLQSMF